MRAGDSGAVSARRAKTRGAVGAVGAVGLLAAVRVDAGIGSVTQV